MGKDFSKERILITGANNGLGYQCAKELLKKGYEVILACRNLQKAESAKKSLALEIKNSNIEILQMDLASLQDIKDKVKEIEKPITGLVCNAGVTFTDKIHRTKEGFEETFGVNHLGHFLLTNLIIEKFSNTLIRIVVVASELHNVEKGTKYFAAPKFNSINELAFPSIDGIEDFKEFGGLCYVNSKLSNVIFTYALCDSLKKNGLDHIFVNAISPGFVPATGLARNQTSVMRFMMKNIMPRMKRFIPGIATVEEGGQAIAKLVYEVSVTGKYFDRLEEIKSSELSYNLALRKELWEVSEKLVGLQAHCNN